MTASYVRPLELAWARVRRLLLEPFRLEVWLIVGFAAALAGLVEWGAWHWAEISIGNAPESVQILRPGLGWWWPGDGGPWWLLLWLPLAAVGLLIAVLLLWVSCRGKLVFLDCLLFERAQIVEPWGRLGRLGDSLFLWWLAFHAGFLLLTALLAVPFLFAGAAMREGGIFGGALVAAQLGVAAMIWVGLAGLYIVAAILLDDFVVPIMYRDGTGAVAAWRRFLGLLRREPASFLIYLVLVVLARVALASAVLLLAIPTCCLLPALLAIPYVSSVLLLPISGTYRLYSVEFLGQFGESWRLPAAARAVEAVPPRPPGP